MVGKKCVVACLGLFASLWLAGCIGGGAKPISVTVTATPTTVDGSVDSAHQNTTALTAAVTNDKNPGGVTWTTSAGTLSNSTTTSATLIAPAPTSSAQTITVTATSVGDSTKTGTATITVPAKPAITTAGTALNSTVGATFNVTLQASGGISPYTWALTSGALPTCLSLNASTGAITGIITATCANSFSPTFTVTDSGSPNKLTATAQLNFTITAATPLALPATLTPATATDGVAYIGSVAATGGVAPLTYSVTSGALPSWANLNPTTGAITGTPTAVGTSNFTIQVADNFGDTPATQAYTLTVNPGAATHFAVAATTSTTITAGGTVNYTVTALDVNGATATAYAGTVHFTSADTLAVLPGDSALSNGIGSFQATLKTSGTQSITATDSVTGSITGTLSSITVNAGAVSKLALAAPSTSTAGTAFNLTVMAQDTYGNTVTGYGGTVAITSSDGAAVLPSNSTLTSGTKIFSVTLKTVGTQTVTATDTVTGSLTVTSGNIAVSAAPASTFTVQAPATATAGTPVSVSITAKDTYGNTATAYSGTVHFTSSDGSAVLPANSTLTSGTGTFQVTLKTAGTQTVTATDTVTGSITGSTGSIAVSPAAVSHLAVSAPGTATAGTAFSVTVTAQDAYNNTITNYSGTVHFTSTDSSAVLPADSTLTNGAGTFQATLKTSGSQAITATDTVNGAITGISPAITVNAAAASTLTISAPGTANAGVAVSVTVTAKDTYGNTATGYSGTVHFTSTDSLAVLPADSTLTSGTGTFQATLKTSGSQTVTATDTVNGSLTATTSSIAVSAGTATLLQVSAPSTTTAGVALTVSVTAHDAFNNIVTGYSGTVHFTSTDGAAVLPANTTLTNGAGSFSATLKTSGTQSITATDTVTGSITGTTGSITVNPAAAAKLLVSAPAAATNNVAFNISVTAQDAFNNTATSYAGTVHFTSTDGAAVLPADSALTSGTGSFSATLKTNGTQTISAVDTGNASVNGISGSINVSTALIITTSTLSKGAVGSSYSQTLTASGGTGTGYTFSETTSTLSGFGLSIASNGTISGTPTQSGTVSFTAKVTDLGSNTATQNLSIQIYPAYSLPAANSLPGATVLVPYSASVTPTGGSGTYCFTVTGLPADGLTKPANNSTCGYVSSSLPITGTPTNPPTPPYNITFTVTATDTSTDIVLSRTYTISVTTALSITTTTLPVGNQGVAYSQSVAATGGTGSGYTYTETTSTLAGFGLSIASDGTISGTPTQTGTVNFTVQVTDSGSHTATQNLSIQFYAALVLPAANSLPSGYTGAAYNQAITGSGGSGTLTISITSALSPTNGTLAAAVSNPTVNITGTPTTAVATESITVKLLDTTTNLFITRTYTFAIIAATAPSLPTAALPDATLNVSYSQTITATGGIGPNYTWKVNGSTSVPTNGSLVSVGNGLSVSNTGNNVLTVSGTPTTTTTVLFSAQVTDTTTTLTSINQNYSITVNNTSQVAGSIYLSNTCGNFGFTMPTFNISINTSPATQVTTDSSGQFTFPGVPDGTYTITPSYSGPSGSSAVFIPATQSVTVNNGTVNVNPFYVSLGYTVTGTVSYSGTHTGQIYVDMVNNNCSGTGGSGTSISPAGSYTLHGVPPGSYTSVAWMDATDMGLGQGIGNTADPAGSASGSVLGNSSGVNITITNHNPTAIPAETPSINAAFGTHNGVVMVFDPAQNVNRVETANSYDVAWSTSPTLSSGALATIAGTYNYKANGRGTVWILNNSITGASSFTDGTPYYFMARANNSFGHGAWVVYGGGTPTPTTPNPPTGAATISGNVTIPVGVTVGANAKLYVGFFSDTMGIQAAIVNSPAVGSNNPFTVNVPNGSWQFFAILDQNNDGIIDTGDVSNTRNTQGGPPTVTINGSATKDVTLSNSSLTSAVLTRYIKYIGNSGTGESYALTIAAGPGTKLPVAVELTAASNPNFLVPMDISNYCFGCGNAQFQIYQYLSTAAPNIGDTYTFTVKYSDGSTDPNVTAAVTGWNSTSTPVGPNAIVTNLLPSGATGPSAGTRTQPTFTWTYPAGASTAGDYYKFSICCSNSNDIWDVPSQNGNSNGFLYSQVPGGSLTWNVDPTGGGSTTTVTNLTTGTSYDWYLVGIDANGNEAVSGTWYQP